MKANNLKGLNMQDQIIKIQELLLESHEDGMPGCKEAINWLTNISDDIESLHYRIEHLEKRLKQEYGCNG